MGRALPRSCLLIWPKSCWGIHHRRMSLPAAHGAEPARRADPARLMKWVASGIQNGLSDALTHEMNQRDGKCFNRFVREIYVILSRFGIVWEYVWPPWPRWQFPWSITQQACFFFAAPASLLTSVDPSLALTFYIQNRNSQRMGMLKVDIFKGLLLNFTAHFGPLFG